MPELIIWKNRQMDKLRRDMDRLCTRVCDEFGIPLFPTTAREVPIMDMSETEEALIIKAEVPGVDPEDLDIAITEDTLTIRGQSKKEVVEDREEYRRTERHYGSFSRTLQLPYRINTDDVKATYKKGTLSIVMAKSKPEKAREIKIKVKAK